MTAARRRPPVMITNALQDMQRMRMESVKVCVHFYEYTSSDYHNKLKQLLYV